MEAVGSATSIIALIQLSGKVASLTYGYIGGVKRASQDLKDLVDELKSLNKVLNILKDHVDLDPLSPALQTLAGDDGPLQECVQELRRLQKELERGKGKGFIGRIKGIMKSLMWPLNESETLQLISRIERHKSLFNLALTIDQTSRSKKLEIQLQQLQVEAIAWGEKDDFRHIKEKRKKVLDWLSPNNLNDKHAEISHQRQKDTGLWLLETPEFKELVKRDRGRRLLWGYAIPGAGKTFLSSLVIDHLKELSPEGYGVAYIYFDYKEQDQQKPLHTLASLVKQLATQAKCLPTVVETLYDKLEPQDKRPTLEELYDVLVEISTSFSRLFFVFDALDECHPEDQRRELLPLFHRMGKDGFSLFLTSRQHPEDIRISFRNVAKVELLAREKDIKAYIIERIDENPRASRLVKQGKCQERIISDLSECAQGMFLFARFHIEFLCQQTTVRQIISELDRLKESSATVERRLDPTYERALGILFSQHRNCVDLALNTLSWLVKARRTLTVDEIRTGLSIEPKRYDLDETNLPDGETLLDVCVGLVTIDENTNTIRLAHYTVQEYILRRAIIPDDAELKLAMACTTYLSFDSFSQGACNSRAALISRYELYPFLHYAVRYACSHLQSCDEFLSAEFLLRFLGNPGSISSYQQGKRCWGGGVSTFNSWGWDRSPDGSALHVASVIGNHTVVRLVLEGLKPGYSASDEWATLYLAATKWDDIFIHRLLHNKVDILTLDRRGDTALHTAAAEGKDSIARLLIEKGCDVLVKSRLGYTALHLAARGGHKAVAQLLIEKGSDVSQQDKYGHTALHLAARSGYEAVVRLLIDKGCSVSLQNKYGDTALNLAARGGHEATVRLLVDKGCDVSLQNKDGSAALHLAANGGYEAVVRLLIEKGSDVSLRIKYESTALHLAASGGFEAVARLLIDKGCGVSLQNKDGSTALHLAARGGYETVVQLLIDKGCDVSLQNKVGHTALNLAERGGYESVVQWLTKKGV